MPRKRFSKSQDVNITIDTFVRNNSLLNQIAYILEYVFLLADEKYLFSNMGRVKNWFTGYSESELRANLIQYKNLVIGSDTISIYISRDRLQPKVFSQNLKMVVHFSNAQQNRSVIFSFGRFKDSTIELLCLYRVKFSYK